MFGIVSRLCDVLLIAAGAWLAHGMRYDGSFVLTNAERFLVVQSCVFALLVFPPLGVYRSWRGQTLYRLLSRVTLAWLAVVVLGLCVVFSLHLTNDISRLWFGQAVLTSGALLLVERVIVRAFQRHWRKSGKDQRNVVIVGAGSYGRAVLAQLQAAAPAGFTPIYVFDDAAEATGFRRSVSGVPVMTDFRELKRRVRAREVDEMWLALPLSHERTIQRIVRDFRNDFVNLRFLPDVRSMTLLNRSVTEVLNMPAINLATSPEPDPQLWPKFLFDRVFALAVLIPLLPLFIFLGIAVKLSSPGPILFRQKRKGIDGREFNIFKFRTMKVHSNGAGTVRQASRNDPRITKVGAFLRRTSLDELPQFLNVLFGQMSVVGPRPHAIEHDDLYKDVVDGYMYRYRIRPGITGWAQVNGYRGETLKVEKMEARVKFDLFYIQNWTFWFDIKIILITLVKGFVGRNAF
ncbi:undecaprenyl-phosphate glucose phosphotransferase [Paraburkholderia ginsengisoli]|uniref:Undecaprenyl-phosphate glucose phosphotransferase n=1 Tax=Paraburkholderia ginsengisoli TaxID=311231 RepID=A0A7T4N8P8_9BURK|nr:undecaprenyl-phosphate glucose phosphotransferase [Paraburkholderia ginsengisoli]QQC67291.1 undecaprenyl-phosphate glucose phosphotransferase [Paraburkholderia ginsengisoli]